jgi:hypothetical protein
MMGYPKDMKTNIIINVNAFHVAESNSTPIAL